jgi:hypothetical protein
VKKELAEHDFNTLDKVLLRILAEDEQDLSMGEMLTACFCTPNMFITLWLDLIMELTRH